ncbi:hypothetical protein LL046_11500 [Lactococcus lactis subsp. lactis]|uniref:hypothetical protein n=1 Tax=Lactococcus lactis TaxID=1358 RepID=UPI001F1028BE|nr:hypothetical protein [Lactococcus lactis]MCH5425491.1 hypothetical protein [Lactococcus lactis]
MTDISGKSLHEIYKEDARKYKESLEKGRVYSESADSLIGNFDKTESLTVTMPMEEFDKLEKLALSAHTDKLSVEKLQEQLNNAKKYIEHVIGTIKHDGHLGTIQTDWILPDLEKALAAIGGNK